MHLFCMRFSEHNLHMCLLEISVHSGISNLVLDYTGIKPHNIHRHFMHALKAGTFL